MFFKLILSDDIQEMFRISDTCYAVENGSRIRLQN